MKKIVFTFGRMNPPTIGHEKLANKIKAVAKKENADARIYLSHTQNPTKDPLSYKQKLAFAKKAFGIAHKSNAKQIFQILKEIYEEGYTDIWMVVGSDRVKEFDTLIKKYNGRGDYKFDSINVISAGQRDPDAKGVEGMSGTKLRAIAKAGDFDTFKQAAASKLSDRDKKKMMDMVQKALKEAMEEEHNSRFDKFSSYVPEDFDALVEEAVKTIKVGESSVGAKETSYALVKERKILAIGLKDEMLKLAEKEGGRVWKVDAESQVGDLVEQNEDMAGYLKSLGGKRKKSSASDDYFKLKDKMRQRRLSKGKSTSKFKKIGEKKDKEEKDDTEVRQDPDIKDREGTQPAVYYSGDMAKSTKKKRAAAFAKQAKMADDDPKAYKPAPGDASAKTKPSKHTQKYKKMFGEEEQLDEKIKGLEKKSEKSGIAYGILKKVYDRGMAAWKTGHRPGTTPQQWAFARVNSFITGGKTRTTADADLWAKHSGKSEAVSPAQQAAIAIAKKKSGKYDKEGKRIKEAYEYGSDEYTKHTKDMTPGQKDIKAAYNPDDDFSGKPVKKFKDIKKKTRNEITEAIQYHLDTGVPFADNIFRHTSASFYKFFQEARVMHRNGDIQIDSVDKQILETDIGMFGIYEGKEVPLDCPLMEADKDVELNAPKRGGSKKFYVYVKNDKGNVIKVEFGDTSGLKAKINDRDAARSFAARHQCDTKKDKTKPGYWACRLPWYAKALGLEGGGKYFW